MAEQSADDLFFDDPGWGRSYADADCGHENEVAVANESLDDNLKDALV